MPSFLKDITPFLGTGERNEKGETLEEFLEAYDPGRYRAPSVTTDALIFSDEGTPVAESCWKVLLIRRRNHPCIGCWALPGGFIGMEENLEVSAGRELMEETGVEGLPLEPFAVYGNVNRDPRNRVITTAFLSIVEASRVEVKAGDDAADALWFSIRCRKEEEREEGKEKRTRYCLELEAPKRNLSMTAQVEKRERTGLVREGGFSVLEDGKIACDHAAIIVQGWELLKSRMISFDN